MSQRAQRALHPHEKPSVEAGARDDRHLAPGAWRSTARRSLGDGWIGFVLALTAALVFGLAFWAALAFLVYRLVT